MKKHPEAEVVSKLGDKPSNANALLTLRAKLANNLLRAKHPAAQQKPLTPRSYGKE